LPDPVADNDRSKEARAFIDEARRRQAGSGQTLKGRPGLESGQRFAIRAVAVSLVVVAGPLDITQHDMIRILERFEEMCRRQKLEVNAGLRPCILHALVTELWINRQSLDVPLEKLIAATVYHGAFGARLSREFPQFSDTPSLLRNAVVNYPSDPVGFLRKTQKVIDGMGREREFHEFWDTPGIFKQAAVRNPSDPRECLRTIQKTIGAMGDELEFEEFWDTPGIFKQAAISNPSDPREYLRKVQKTVAEMFREQEFAEFMDTPGIFKQAAVRNPQDPRGFMRRIRNTVAAIAKEGEFKEFADKPALLQHAALHNPSDPREFLRRDPKSAWHAMMVKGRKIPGIFTKRSKKSRTPG
jgi:hypothetical protein